MRWLVSGIGRLFFAGFLFVFGLLGMFMAGMAGDAGPNPVFYYCALSVLLFIVSGATILFSSANFLFSESRASRWLWGTFVFSVAQPLVALLIVSSIYQHEQAAAHAGDFKNNVETEYCVTVRQAVPGVRAWVEDSYDGRHFGKFPNRPLGPGENYCQTIGHDAGMKTWYRAYSVTADNEDDVFHTSDTANDLSPKYELPPHLDGKVCIGVIAPNSKANAIGTWQVVRENCGR